MRNVLFDDRVAEALIDWIMENGREIENSHKPCYCDMKICGNDGNIYKFRLYARCEQQSGVIENEPTVEAIPVEWLLNNIPMDSVMWEYNRKLIEYLVIGWREDARKKQNNKQVD